MKNKSGIFLCCFFVVLSFFAKEQPQKKPWTFMVYMAANNDLEIFAPRNIEQMKKIGSNENINIVIHMFTRQNKGKKRKTLFIKKNETILLEETPNSATDCGNEQNLIDFCNNTITHYPAEKYALIMWNHGTGIISPQTRVNFSTSQLFSFSFLKDFSRSQHFLPFLGSFEIKNKPPCKGICFDDSTGNFLTEKKLCKALRAITQASLGGKKIDLIGFDACLMAMLEVSCSLRDYAEIMVGSQEVEPGTGWNYTRVLAPFMYGSVSARILGTHIVNSYAKTYEGIDDYTQSAIDLGVAQELEKNVASVAQHLYNCATEKHNDQWKALLRVSRNRHFCTHFDEPSFIDLCHFYQNLLSNINESPHLKTKSNIKILMQHLESGMLLIKKMVVASKAGSKLSKASGVSIYFPEHTIHSSYRTSKFALLYESWLQLISFYVSC